jgi:hypothetical protein
LSQLKPDVNDVRYRMPLPDDPRTDEDFADYCAWQDREIKAGRLTPPEEEERPRGPVVFPGPVTDADPGLLSGRGFAQDGPAESLAPGPVLAALAENAAADPAALTNNERLGVVSAARRQQAHEAWLELTMIADFILDNRARLRASIERRDQRGRRDGEYAAEELAFQLTISARQAGELADTAVDLKTRLPRTFDGMRAGVISEEKATLIHRRTRLMSDADAAAADEILSAAAPGIRAGSLDAKARKLVRRLDPELYDRAKDDGKNARRVDAWQEESGNGALAGRQLDNTEVLAAKASLREEALRVRRLGAPGTLSAIEAQIYLDRLNGTDTAARYGLTPAAAADPTPAGAANPSNPPAPPYPPGSPEAQNPQGSPGPHGPAGSAEDGLSLAALINIVVPVSAADGQPDASSSAGTYGDLDAADTQAFLAAAARDPRTRWCVTVVDDHTRQAIAHGCARGQHRWAPPPPGTPAQDVAAGLIRDLKPDFEPVARGAGARGRAENQYTPSRKLAHLIRARTNTCPGPGCDAQSLHNELDHTAEWPVGKTEESNLSPPCSRHHKAKHARGWHLEQPAPGVMKWRTPSGRIFGSEPTVYDL